MTDGPDSHPQLVAALDLIAAEYAARFCDELAGKPLDRKLLQRFAAALPDRTAADIGCGPGHVAAYLASLGLSVTGIDLSPAMIAEAARRYPHIDYRVGDMLDLPLATDSLGGLVAFYSIIHLDRSSLPHALREMRRVLHPAGLLLISFHRGEGRLHADDVFGTGAALDLTLFQPEEVERGCSDAGLAVVETTVREPYELEYPTERVYLLARTHDG